MASQTVLLPFSGSDLRNGAILATIAHAIWVTSDSTLANEQYWDNDNYCIQDTQGAFGTITFADDLIVGGFFDGKSEGNPFQGTQEYDMDTVIAEIPDQLRELALEEAFQYMLQDFRGKEIPVVTAAIWGDSRALYSHYRWEYLLRNGAQLIQTQVRPAQEAITTWSENYEMSANQSQLLSELYQRRISSSLLPILLSDAEKKTLIEQGDAGLAQAQKILSSIQIEWS